MFGNYVSMDGDLDVETTVNSVKMANLAQALRSITPRSLSQVVSIARTINDTNYLLKGDFIFPNCCICAMAGLGAYL